MLRRKIRQEKKCNVNELLLVLNSNVSILFQSEIVKRLSAIVGQVLPFLSQEHQQQVATAVERAKQVTMSELNSVIGVSHRHQEI